MVPKWFPLVPIGSLSLIFRAPILTLNPGGLGHSPWPTICRGEFHWWCTRPVRGASRWINPVEKVATNWLRFRRVQESISSQLMSVISQIISLSLYSCPSIYLLYLPPYLSLFLSKSNLPVSIYIYRLFLCHLYVGLNLCLPLYVYLDHPISKSVCLSVCLSLYLFPSIYLLVLSCSIYI